MVNVSDKLMIGSIEYGLLLVLFNDAFSLDERSVVQRRYLTAQCFSTVAKSGSCMPRICKKWKSLIISVCQYLVCDHVIDEFHLAFEKNTLIRMFVEFLMTF